MKVLFVLPNVAVGGVERVRLRLIRRLIAEGDTCLLALRRSRGELLEQARELVDVRELAPRGIHQFIPALARLICQERPTHVVTAFSDVGVLAWIAMRMARSRARWIHSVHNTHSPAGARPGAWGAVRSWLENRMAGFVYRRADAVVAVSDGVRQEILGYYRIPASRVSTIHNPVIPDEQLQWRRPSLEHGDEALRMVCVGRLVKQKGYDVLIRALTHVSGSWRLDIWGDGPERSRLGSMIAESGMSGRIHLRGYTASPLEVMREADCFVMPSRHEGLPATLIEAVACQCQVVATDCPHGPREILLDGKLGLLVPPESTVELAEALMKVIRREVSFDPDALLARAREFSWSRASLEWRRLLQRYQ